jgi:hypothetical protein
MKKFIIREDQFRKLISILKEEDTEDEYYKMTGQEFAELMDQASYNPAVTRIKRFKGKPLYITTKLDLSGIDELTDLGNVVYIDGDLDVSSTNIHSLGNITYINGNLYISHTKIRSLGKTEVKGHVSDYGTPIEKARIRREELAKLSEAESRREDGEWDLSNEDIDEEGMAANALFDELVYRKKLTEMDDEIKEEYNAKKQRLSKLQERYEDIEGYNQSNLFPMGPEEIEALENKISDLENELEEYNTKYADVYYIIPTNYRPYGKMYSFEVVGLRDQEYMVGTEDNAYDAAVENQKQLIDDIGIEGFSEYTIERNMDDDEFESYVRGFYESGIDDSPDSFFNSDDFVLTDEQEERKEELENYINEQEDLKSELEEKLESMQDEEPDELEIRNFLEKIKDKSDIEKNNLINKFAQETGNRIERIKKFQNIINIETQIEQIEENIEKAQDEFDSIEPDTEPTEEMIEEKLDELVESAKKNPTRWCNSYDIDMGQFVSIKALAEYVVDSDGLGVLSSYDGDYDTQKINDTTFVIIRTQ